MKTELLELIRTHNAIVVSLEKSDIKIPIEKLFATMSIWHSLAIEGLNIVSMARKENINCVVSMQNGMITVKGSIL